MHYKSHKEKTVILAGQYFHLSVSAIPQVMSLNDSTQVPVLPADDVQDSSVDALQLLSHMFALQSNMPPPLPHSPSSDDVRLQLPTSTGG
jgi:hypothetical protein